MPRINPAQYSDAPGPCVVEQLRPRVPPDVLAKTLKAMTFRCLECRNGKRKSISGTTITCRRCDGRGNLDAYDISTLGAASGLGVSRTIDATRDLIDRGLAVESMRGGILLYTLTDAGKTARSQLR